MAEPNFARQLKHATLTLMHRLVMLVTRCLLWFVYRGSGEAMPPITNLLLLDSASALAHKIRTRKVTSVEVLEAFIARIHEVNPILNCVVEDRFEKALQDARAADKLIESGEKSEQELAQQKPFLGVPLTTKDCIQVEGLLNTAGLYQRRHLRAPEDAEVIRLMRAAGAIPLAITNVPELCMWWDTVNTIYGRTYNPYNTNHIVGGSSGGEGCLQAAAGSAFGIGSDIGGSIRMPCFFNGIFGHKPSRGLVSNHGEYPIPTGEQDTYLGTGPMCRFASDLLPVLKVIAGKNGEKIHLDKKVDISKLKVYYMEDDGGSLLTSPVHPEIKAVLRQVVQHLNKAYNIKAQKVCLKNMKKSAAIWFAKMNVEGNPSFAEQLANRQGSVNIYLELVKWVLCLSKHTLPALCTAITDKTAAQHGSEKHTYLVNLCKHLGDEFREMLGTDGLFLFPTHPTPAPYHNEPLVKPFNFSYTAIFNVLGLPATHCPLGLGSEGLPLGIQVVGPMNMDHHTLAMALELERAFGGWVPPAIAV